MLEVHFSKKLPLSKDFLEIPISRIWRYIFTDYKWGYEEWVVIKTTGIIVEVDNLGRIVLPEEIRYELGMQDDEKLVIYADAKTVRLKKHRDAGTSQIRDEKVFF